jgi:hypothetical protein
MPAPTPPNPIALSDEALSFIMRITEPLNPNDRSGFLRALANRLRHEPELAEGVIYRVARETLRDFWRAPALDHAQAMLTPAKLRRQREAAPLEH